MPAAEQSDPHVSRPERVGRHVSTCRYVLRMSQEKRRGGEKGKRLGKETKERRKGKKIGRHLYSVLRTPYNTMESVQTRIQTEKEMQAAMGPDAVVRWAVQRTSLEVMNQLECGDPKSEEKEGRPAGTRRS